MNCREIRELLPLHLYADLNDGETRAVAAHLGDCADCRDELAALAQVQRGLDSLPVIPTSVDATAILESETWRLQHRARRWRLAALVASAATVLALVTQIEVRVGVGQLVVRWGDPPTRPSPGVQHVIVESVPPPPLSDERLRTMSELIRALAANLEEMDRQQRDELIRLQREMNELQRTNHRRLAETERDVSALYAAQFRSRPSGVNP